MNYYKITALVALMIASGSAMLTAQSGSISGQVRSSEDTPAEYINVVLVGTTSGTVTDQNGSYLLSRIPAGDYTIEYSLVGLKTVQRQITVVADEKLVLPTVVLDEDRKTLDEVVINAQRLNQFAQKSTPYVTRLPLANVNTPQSYTVVTDELIAEQLNTDLPSSLKSITGGGYVEANTGAVSVYVRGFRNDARTKNGLLLYNRARTVLENQNLERVEVIKGPSAVGYGSGFYGGVINMATKKPTYGDILDLSYNVGSFGLHRATVDFNKSMGEHQQYKVRVNSAFHTEGGYQEKGSEIRQHFFVAPSFTYSPSEKLDITISAELLSGKRNLNFARGIGPNVEATTWDALAWDYDNSYTSKDAVSTTGYSLVQGEVGYTITSHWKSTTSLSYQAFEADGPYIRLVALTNTNLVRQALGFDPEKGGALNVRQDFIGDYEFFAVKNKTLIGLSYYSGSWDYTQVRAERGFFATIDAFDVSANPTIQNLTNGLIDGLLPNRVEVESGNNTLAGYVSNATTINDAVTVLAGMRYDNFKNNATVINGSARPDEYDQGKLSYNLGLTINPMGDAMGFFANYMNGYNNTGPGTNADGNVQNFDPVEARQWELGLKFNLLEGRLKSTVSYYNIDIDNAILSYRTPDLVYQAQDGVIASKGVELDIIANPINGLNLVAGYTFNDAKNVKYSTPTVEGNKLDLSPETVANFWASYKMVKGALKGFGLGIGANHMSEIFSARNVLNTFSAKPFTTIDGTVFYQQNKYRIGLKLNNMTNEEYYNAYGVPQKTFNFVLGLKYDIL